MRVVLLLVGLGLVGIGLYVAIRLPTLPGESNLRWRSLEVHSTSVGVTFVVLGVAGVAAAAFVPAPPSSTGSGSGSAGPRATVTAFRTATVQPTVDESGGRDPTTTPSPDDTPPAAPEPEPPDSDPAEGTVLASYSIDLPSGYAIRRFDEGRPQPSQDTALGFDLWWTGLSSTFRTTSQLALLEDADPSYQDCKANTRYSDFVMAGAAGQTLCFSGHGVIAAVTLEESVPVGEPTQYVPLDVVVWQGPGA